MRQCGSFVLLGARQDPVARHDPGTRHDPGARHDLTRFGRRRFPSYTELHQKKPKNNLG